MDEKLISDTDSILSMISVKTYYIGELGTKELKALKRENVDFRTLKERIKSTCLNLYNTYTHKDTDAVVTIQVNKLIVALCVLVLKTHPESHQKYYECSVLCSMEGLALKTYVVREAERFALKRDVPFVKIKVTFEEQEYIGAYYGPKQMSTRIRYLSSIGYEIVPAGHMCGKSAPRVDPSVLHSILQEIETTYARKRGDSDSESDDSDSDDSDSRDSDSQTSNDLSSYPRLHQLINGVVGKRNKIAQTNGESVFRKWNDSLVSSGSMGAISSDHISMWKCLEHNAEIILPSYTGRGTYPNGPRIDTLAIETDVFIGMIEVRIRDINTVTDEERKQWNLVSAMASTCQDRIAESFVNTSLNSPRADGEAFFLTTKISDTLLSFATIMIKDTRDSSDDDGGHQPARKRVKKSIVDQKYLYVDLVCARKYSSLGHHMMGYIESFAARRKIKYVSLDAKRDVYKWYLRQGYKTGDIYEFELDEDLKSPDSGAELITMTKRL